MDGTATINAKVDSLRLCGFVQNLGCAKPRLLGYLYSMMMMGTMVRLYRVLSYHLSSNKL